MTKTTLSIRDFELSVYLGWPEEERAEQQIVHLDIDIHFTEIPKGYFSDDLKDTFCYATFLSDLQEKFKAKPIKLIERLAFEIYHLLKKSILLSAKVKVRVTKYPPVIGLVGGASFVCEDE